MPRYCGSKDPHDHHLYEYEHDHRVRNCTGLDDDVIDCEYPENTWFEPNDGRGERPTTYELSMTGEFYRFYLNGQERVHVTDQLTIHLTDVLPRKRMTDEHDTTR